MMASKVKRFMVVRVARRSIDVGETANDDVDDSYAQKLLCNQ